MRSMAAQARSYKHLLEGIHSESTMGFGEAERQLRGTGVDCQSAASGEVFLQPLFHPVKVSVPAELTFSSLMLPVW